MLKDFTKMWNLKNLSWGFNRKTCDFFSHQQSIFRGWGIARNELGSKQDLHLLAYSDVTSQEDISNNSSELGFE